MDLRGGTITVAPQGQKRSTKDNLIRRIPINSALRPLLKKHPKMLGSKLVFPDRAGGRYEKIDRQLDEAAERAGIEGRVRLHQLRHAFCSHAFMNGVDARTIQKWMGHASLTTTLRYAHTSPEHEKRAKLNYGAA